VGGKHLAGDGSHQHLVIALGRIQQRARERASQARPGDDTTDSRETRRAKEKQTAREHPPEELR
jgi:hypothetical protein